jgi:hypothetical protein
MVANRKIKIIGLQNKESSKIDILIERDSKIINIFGIFSFKPESLKAEMEDLTPNKFLQAFCIINLHYFIMGDLEHANY